MNGRSLSGENEELKFHIICQEFLANFFQTLRAICGMFKIKKRLTRSSKKIGVKRNFELEILERKIKIIHG